MQTGAGAEAGELGYCAWFGFWVPLVVLGFLVVVGAFFAGEAEAPGDEVCGLLLSLAAIGLAFLHVKRRFDGDGRGWADVVFVDDMPNLVLAIVVFVILAILGLLAAAQLDYGGLHNGGIALFVISALGVFFSIKRVFDNLDRRLH